jgi:hypothetical protein
MLGHKARFSSSLTYTVYSERLVQKARKAQGSSQNLTASLSKTSIKFYHDFLDETWIENRVNSLILFLIP